MRLFGRSPDVDAAEAAADELVATVARWQTEGDTAAAEAEDLVGRVGELALDDEGAGARAADDIARLRARVQVARAAAAAGAKRLLDARRELLRARAAVLRARVARLRAAAGKRQATTDRLLTELSAHESASFVPQSELLRVAPAMTGRSEWAVPLTVTITAHASHVDGLAVELERVAADGSANDVAAALAVPLPERSALDLAVGDDGAVDASAGPFNRVVRQSI